MKRFVLCVILLSSYVFASDSARVGNGGGVLFCQDREPIILDLYESIFYEIETFNDLNNTPASERERLLEKRIALFYPRVGKIFKKLRTFFGHKRNFLEVSSFKIPDDFNNLFYESICQLEVVVVQRRPILPFDDIFFINRDLWNLSGHGTQEALIDHELLYLIALSGGAEDSKKVREFLAYILSDRYRLSDTSERRSLFKEKILNNFARSLSNSNDDMDDDIISEKICKKLKSDYFFDCSEI